MKDAASFEELLDTVGEMVVRRDAAGRVVYVNAAFRRAFGGDASDWRGKWLEISGPGDRPMSNGRARFDVDAKTVSGPACIEWEVTRLPEGGAIAVGRDVSARRASETALRDARETIAANARAREMLFATITHELRTPVTGVMGMADLLASTGLDGEQRAYLAAIGDSGRHLLGLVDNILDAAKLEAGAITLEPENTDLADLLCSVAELVSPRARAKGVETAVFVDPRTPALVRADSGRLRQVLLNIAGNAVKFTDDGGVIFSLDVEGECPDDTSLVFRISDTGPGIAPAERERIFDAFAQAQAQAAACAEGAGLGLAIVRRLVDAMDGEISVDDAEIGGAEFTIRLRFQIVAAAEDNIATSLSGVRAMVAGPVASACAPVARQLRAFGAQTAACDSYEALAAALRADPDQVFLVDAAWADRHDADIGAARAVVLMAAPDQRAGLEDCLARGFAGWVVKPLRPSSLASQVGRAWRGEAAAPQRQVFADAPLAAERYRSRAEGLRVLLVEDDPVNRLAASTLLKRMGAAVIVAETGDAAIEAAANQRFDLVLMDMRLPGCDGPEATRRIRASGGENAETPIVALTANAGGADRNACLSAGMSAFMVKPINAERLAEVIGRWTSARPDAIVR